LHHMLNFVTGPEGSPEAVLIRALRITEGGEIVRRRRAGIGEKDWASGPGRVGLALGLGREHSGLDLTGNVLWVEDRGLRVPAREILLTPRIGVDYAGIWARKPWRFVWNPAGKSG
jgi:DNA-3-methyladenine glycosylase